MVALKLIVRAPIFRADVEALEMRTVRDAECDSNKAALRWRRVRRGIAGQSYFDCSVPESRSLYDRQPVIIAGFRRRYIRDANGRDPAICNGVRLHVAQFEIVKPVEGDFKRDRKSVV